MDKLYIVTRTDLAPGLAASQLCHALRQFVAEHPDVDRPWYHDSKFLVLLEVPGREQLAKLVYDAARERVPLSLWQEPDMQQEPTALALGPTGRRLVAQLPLALRKAFLGL